MQVAAAQTALAIRLYTRGVLEDFGDRVALEVRERTPDRVATW